MQNKLVRTFWDSNNMIHTCFLSIYQWFASVNHARIHSWNQPVLSNESKVSCTRKQRGPLMGLKLTTDRYPPIWTDTGNWLTHCIPVVLKVHLLPYCLKFSPHSLGLWYVYAADQKSPSSILKYTIWQLTSSRESQSGQHLFWNKYMSLKTFSNGSQKISAVAIK